MVAFQRLIDVDIRWTGAAQGSVVIAEVGSWRVHPDQRWFVVVVPSGTRRRSWRPGCAWIVRPSAAGSAESLSHSHGTDRLSPEHLTSPLLSWTCCLLSGRPTLTRTGRMMACMRRG